MPPCFIASAPASSCEAVPRGDARHRADSRTTSWSPTSSLGDDAVGFAGRIEDRSRSLSHQCFFPDGWYHRLRKVRLSDRKTTSEQCNDDPELRSSSSLRLKSTVVTANSRVLRTQRRAVLTIAEEILTEMDGSNLQADGHWPGCESINIGE